MENVLFEISNLKTFELTKLKIHLFEILKLKRFYLKSQNKNVLIRKLKIIKNSFYLKSQNENVFI